MEPRPGGGVFPVAVVGEEREHVERAPPIDGLIVLETPEDVELSIVTGHKRAHGLGLRSDGSRRMVRRARGGRLPLRRPCSRRREGAGEEGRASLQSPYADRAVVRSVRSEQSATAEPWPEAPGHLGPRDHGKVFEADVTPLGSYAYPARTTSVTRSVNVLPAVAFTGGETKSASPDPLVTTLAPAWITAPL